MGTVSPSQESAEAGVSTGHRNSYPGELTERLTELQTQSKALRRCPAPRFVEGQLADEVRALPRGPASGAGPAVKNRAAGAGGEPAACLCLCRTPERAQLALLWQGLGRKMLREEDTVTTSPKERSSGGEALCISPVQMYFPCADEKSQKRKVKRYCSDAINGDPAVTEPCKDIRSTQ